MKYLLVKINSDGYVMEEYFQIFSDRKAALDSIAWLDEWEQDSFSAQGWLYSSEMEVTYYLFELPENPENHLQFSKKTEKQKQEPKIKKVSFAEALEITKAKPQVLKNLTPEYLLAAFNLIIEEK